MRHLVRPLLYVTALAAAAPAAAHANVISGSIYCNVSSSMASNTPDPSVDITSGTLCATFQSSAINFASSGGNQNTVGQFLSSNNLLLDSITYLNGFSADSSLDDSVFRFSGYGSFQNGQTYSATHDDGTVMSVDGTTVLSAPSPTSAITDTFTWSGDSGNYNFIYDFSEVEGATVYATDATNNPVPEPATATLLGSGILASLAMIRRRHQHSEPPLVA